MIDRNGNRIYDGDYVTTPVGNGIVVSKNPATALVKIMNADTGNTTWVYPNHCTVIDESDEYEDGEFTNQQQTSARLLR